MAKNKDDTKALSKGKKAQKQKHDAPGELLLEYHLHDLPTAQHKAGLAGLLLMSESMKRRKIPDIPEALNVTATGATIRFTAASLQALAKPPGNG